MPVPSADKDVVQLDLSYIDGRNAKWFNHLENNLAVSYKLKLTFTIQPPPPSYWLKLNKNTVMLWPVWLNWLSAVPRSKRLLVTFPV